MDKNGGRGELLRLALVAPVPERLKHRLASVLEELQADAWDLRPAPEDLHLTLHLLGDTPARLVDDLKREIGAVCHARRPFDLRVGGLTCFPDDAQPRQIFLEIQDRAGLWRELCGVTRRVLRSYRLFDLAPDRAPLLRLARVERLGAAWDPRWLRGLSRQWDGLGSFPLERVCMLSGVAGPTPGPRHEVLASLGLGGQP